jgi:hypothetical protein
MEMLSTTNYRLFKANEIQPNKSNREKISHSLLASLVKTNGNILQPLIVKRNSDGTYTILDGHRRFEHLKRAKLNVYFVIVDCNINSEELMINLNNESKQWRVIDYIELRALGGRKYWSKIYSYVIDNNIPLEAMVSFSLLTNNKLKDGVEVHLNWNSINKRVKLFKYIKSKLPRTNTNDIHRAIKDVYEYEKDIPSKINIKDSASKFTRDEIKTLLLSNGTNTVQIREV